MKNIYRPWLNYSKSQKSLLSAEKLKKRWDLGEKKSETWRGDFPEGEDWRYVPFDSLRRKDLQWPKAGPENNQKTDPSFVNIEISSFHQPGTIKNLSLPKGLRLLPQLESDELPSTLSFTDTNPFAESSDSFFGMGWRLEIDKSFSNEKPVKLVFNFGPGQASDLYIHQNLEIVCATESKAQVFIEIQGSEFKGLSNLCVQTWLADSAQLYMYAKEVGNSQSYCSYNMRASLQERALLRHFDFTFPSLWSRHNLEVDLLKSGADVALIGAYFNNEAHFCDHHTRINHQVGTTESKEDYRGILADQSKAVFNGKVFIAEKASRSNSEQINKNLMLSKKAEVNTKPELQIFNDDVKAAHGATVGQLDEEQRFYLQSRGYSASQAGQVLSKAFVYGLLDAEDERVKDFYFPEINQTLSTFREA